MANTTKQFTAVAKPKNKGDDLVDGGVFQDSDILRLNFTSLFTTFIVLIIQFSFSCLATE